MLCSRTINKLAREVSDKFSFIELTHATCVCYICHMGIFNIIHMAVTLHFFAVFGFYHNCHTLLRLANSQFGRIQTAILGRYTIEIDIQSVCQFTDSYTHSTRTEIIGFLNKTRHFWTAHKALQFAFLRGIPFLYLAATRLKRCLGMLFGRTRCSTDAIATCTAT